MLPIYLAEHPKRQEWENRNELGPDSFSDRIFDFIQHYYPNVQDILDLGMCNGGLVRSLRQAGKRAFGIDRRIRASEGLIIADARQLPFKDETFDIVTEAYLIADMGEFQKLPRQEWEKAILEARRVLKIGGIFMTLPYAGISEPFFNKTILNDNNVWGIYQK